MLLSFRVENFKSFYKQTELLLTPGSPRKHKEHIVKGKSNYKDFDLLKLGLIYGANASGKSNLVDAINFAKSIINDVLSINDDFVIPTFKLDKESHKKPVLFEFVIKSNDVFYKYGFSIYHNIIESEWLYIVNKRTNDKKIFTRESGRFDVSFLKENATDGKFVEFLAIGCPKNKLFLTEFFIRNLDNTHIKRVFHWFKNILTVIYPDSIYPIQLELKRDEFKKKFMSILNLFDTGIKTIDYKQIEEEKYTDEKSDRVKIKLLDKNRTSRKLIEKIIITEDEHSNKIAEKLITRKESLNSEDIEFEFNEESDGTQRLFDLIPALILSNLTEKVFVIDEIERSLHPALTSLFIELFIKFSKSSQLILTTHELNLLDLDFLRRDEIWFMEKDKIGSSQLYSLEEFKPRFDKDIKKSYLLGRFGGIPFRHNVEFYNDLLENTEND